MSDHDGIEMTEPTTDATTAPYPLVTTAADDPEPSGDHDALTPPAGHAPLVAVLSWIAALSGTARTEVGSVEVERHTATITIVADTVAGYREWCAMLDAPQGIGDGDELGSYATTTARCGGWTVHLVTSHPIPVLLADVAALQVAA